MKWRIGVLEAAATDTTLGSCGHPGGLLGATAGSIVKAQSVVGFAFCRAM